MGDILGMSGQERERLVIIQQVVSQQLRQSEAADRIGVSVRQIKRLIRAWRQEGDAGLVSKRRGRPPPNRLSPDLRAGIEGHLRGRYAGFGAGTTEALEEAFATQETRRLSPALSFSYKGTLYSILPKGAGTALRGAQITLYTFLDGWLEVRHKNSVLPHLACAKAARLPASCDAKTLDEYLDKA